MPNTPAQWRTSRPGEHAVDWSAELSSDRRTLTRLEDCARDAILAAAIAEKAAHEACEHVRKHEAAMVKKYGNARPAMNPRPRNPSQYPLSRPRTKSGKTAKPREESFEF